MPGRHRCLSRLCGGGVLPAGQAAHGIGRGTAGGRAIRGISTILGSINVRVFLLRTTRFAAPRTPALRNGKKPTAWYGYDNRGAGNIDNRLLLCYKYFKRGRDLMLRVAAFCLIMFLGAVPEAASAQSTYCDSFGNCTGGGVNTYTDSFGNTTGTVGGSRYSTYSDSFGNTTGSIGDNRLNLYSDGFGNTTGSVGNNRVRAYQDSFGNTTGSIGNDRFSCYTDSFGNTTCR